MAYLSKQHPGGIGSRAYINYSDFDASSECLIGKDIMNLKALAFFTLKSY